MTPTCTPGDGRFLGRVTFPKHITLTGTIEYLYPVDGGVPTHVAITTSGRDRPTIIPIKDAIIEPVPSTRLESDTPVGPGGV